MKIRCLFLLCFIFNSALSFSRPLNELEKKKLEFIEDSFRQGDKRANYWQWGYFGLYSAGAVFGLGKYIYLKGRENITDDEAIDKQESAVNFVKATLGSFGLWFRPLVADRALKELTGLPEDDLKLKRAEELLESSAKRVRGELSWKRRLAAFTLNLIGGYAISTGGNSPKRGLINFLIGMTVSEIQIRTVPERPVRDLLEYQKKFQNKETTVWDNIKVIPSFNSIYVSYSF